MRVALDTNVVSEVIKPHCDPNVLSWIRGLATADLALPAPCLAELHVGLHLLPNGARRQRLERAVEAFIDEIPMILPFDRSAAEAFADIATAPGRPRPTMDALIASICVGQGLPLATRNVRDFAGCGMGLINPWEP
ncbi:hypothetical protein GA0111570_104172 [Raineyella antarctica]|uniref:PIN domain-containing protein n=1 Tax=Raineyella antarctica TaxID=1577474 RepID=A0A1G6GNR8_9ACTN|nr:type II toxin-antitoxin system VapC family toxin [Raineyella antarctica]SDB83652.1 hypothetical protein GA0111570_104172 [Raineyella antarctica]